MYVFHMSAGWKIKFRTQPTYFRESKQHQTFTKLVKSQKEYKPTSRETL